MNLWRKNNKISGFRTGNLSWKDCDNEWIYGGKITKYQGLKLETFHEKTGQLPQVNNSQPRESRYRALKCFSLKRWGAKFN